MLFAAGVPRHKFARLLPPHTDKPPNCSPIAIQFSSSHERPVGARRALIRARVLLTNLDFCCQLVWAVPFRLLPFALALLLRSPPLLGRYGSAAMMILGRSARDRLRRAPRGQLGARPFACVVGLNRLRRTPTTNANGPNGSEARPARRSRSSGFKCESFARSRSDPAASQRSATPAICKRPQVVELSDSPHAVVSGCGLVCVRVTCHSILTRAGRELDAWRSREERWKKIRQQSALIRLGPARHLRQAQASFERAQAATTATETLRSASKFEPGLSEQFVHVGGPGLNQLVATRARAEGKDRKRPFVLCCGAVQLFCNSLQQLSCARFAFGRCSSAGAREKLGRATSAQGTREGRSECATKASEENAAERE